MKKNITNILIIFLVALFIMMPLLEGNYHSGHDTKYHLANVIALKDQISLDNPLPSIVGQVGNNFGYGTRLFYPPLPHLFTAYISKLFNLDVIFSFKLVHLIVLLLSGITSYFLSSKLSKNKKVALISSIIYMAFPYHISDIFVRDAYSECFLFIFLPLIFLGLFELFDNHKKQFYLWFTIGYIGGILSHFTMMIYFTLLLLIYLGMNLKKVLTKEKLIPLIISSIIALLTVSPFLVTMFEHRFLGNYAVFLPNLMAQGIWWAGLNPLDYINIFKHFNTNDIKFYFDVVTIFLLVGTLIKKRKFILENKNYKFIFIFSLTTMVLGSFLFPWDILPQTLRMIQFPWRMEVFIALAISLIAPLYIKDFKKRNYLISLIVLGLMIGANINTNFASKEVITLKDVWYNGGMGWQKEYLPANTLNNITYFDNRDHNILIKNGNSDIVIEKDNVPSLVFEVNNIKGETTIELPRLYYLGYELKDDNNKKLKLYENDLGFIETKIIKNGTYHLKYKGTNLYIISLYVSVITIIISIILISKKEIYGKN